MDVACLLSSLRPSSTSRLSPVVYCAYCFELNSNPSAALPSDLTLQPCLPRHFFLSTTLSLFKPCLGHKISFWSMLSKFHLFSLFSFLAREPLHHEHECEVPSQYLCPALCAGRGREAERNTAHDAWMRSKMARNERAVLDLGLLSLFSRCSRRTRAKNRYARIRPNEGRIRTGNRRRQGEPFRAKNKQRRKTEKHG